MDSPVLQESLGVVRGELRAAVGCKFVGNAVRGESATEHFDESPGAVLCPLYNGPVGVPVDDHQV